jgi:hypothetical protein
MLKVPVERGTFDQKVLTGFQENPAIITNFMALYVKFLAGNGTRLVQRLKPLYFQLRDKYAGLGVARYADSAAVLELQANLLCQFGLAYGLEKAELDELFAKLVAGIETLANRQAVETIGNKPVKKFLTALFEKGYGGTGIADNPSAYNANPDAYVGVRTCIKGVAVFCILQDAAFKRVRTYWQNMGRPFTVSDKAIKEKLASENLIRFTPRSNNRSAEYTFHIPGLPSRTRMMIYYIENIDKYLEENHDK